MITILLLAILAAVIGSWIWPRKKFYPQAILDLLRDIQRKVHIMAHTLDETLTAVQNESTVDDSIIALLTGIKAQLDAALGGALPPDVQAKVDAIFDAANANSAKVANAVTANTPAVKASESEVEPPPPGSTEGPGK